MTDITLKTQTGTEFTVAKEQLNELAVLSLEEAMSIARREEKTAVKLTLEKTAIIAEALALAGAPDVRDAFTMPVVSKNRASVDRVTADIALLLLKK